jgi:hypothetical protein
MPVYYVVIPVSKLKVNILKRRINKEYLADFSERVYKSGIKYPIILRDKGTEIECLLGNTRIQVAIMLKLPTIACLLITTKYYKDLKRVESFEDFMCQANLTKHDALQGVIKPTL